MIGMYIVATPMEYLREVSQEISHFWIYIHSEYISKGNEIIISKIKLCSRIHCINIDSSLLLLLLLLSRFSRV